MSDQSYYISKSELLGLLKKAFEAGWSGYKEAVDDVSLQLVDEYLKTQVKKTKSESSNEKDIAYLKKMSEKIGAMITPEVANEYITTSNNGMYTYTTGYTPYARGQSLNQSGTLTVSNSSAGNLVANTVNLGIR